LKNIKGDPKPMWVCECFRQILLFPSKEVYPHGKSNYIYNSFWSLHFQTSEQIISRWHEIFIQNFLNSLIICSFQSKLKVVLFDHIELTTSVLYDSRIFGWDWFRIPFQ
jgi:hypothetical protein